MKTTVYCPGAEYSAKKKKFKTLLRTLDITWCGNMREYVWKGSGTTILAHFERVDDVTKEATFELSGKITNVKAIAEFLVSELNGKEEKPLTGFDRDLKVWEIIHREPKRSEYEYRNAPQGLIDAHHAEWVKEREEYIKQLKEGKK